MGVDPARLPEDQARPVGSGRHRGAGPAGGAEPAGFDPSGFERNGVDRIPEGDRTSTPTTFFVIFIGGSVGLGAVAFGWVGMTFGLGLWATISAIAVGTAVGHRPADPADPARVAHRDEQRDVVGGGVRRPGPADRQRDRAA